jgi:hypothetical protein
MMLQVWLMKHGIACLFSAAPARRQDGAGGLPPQPSAPGDQYPLRHSKIKCILDDFGQFLRGG